MKQSGIFSCQIFARSARSLCHVPHSNPAPIRCSFEGQGIPVRNVLEDVFTAWPPHLNPAPSKPRSSHGVSGYPIPLPPERGSPDDELFTHNDGPGGRAFCLRFQIP